MHDSHHVYDLRTIWHLEPGDDEGCIVTHANWHNCDSACYINDFLNAFSYYYCNRPDFLSSNYDFPSFGPNTNLDHNYLIETTDQGIPAEDRWEESIRTYINPTDWPDKTYVSGQFNRDIKLPGSLVHDVQVIGDLVVLSGATLTIEPGINLLFNDNTGITVDGTLDAQGTSSDPIVFTSANASPSPCDWDGIRFQDSSVDTDCIIKHCEIEYASNGIYCYYANPAIQNNTISNCNKGIYLYYSSPTNVETNYITENGRGIYGVTSYATLTDNYFYDNSGYGVCFSGGAPHLYNNTFYRNYMGAYIVSGSDPNFGPTSGDDKGYNILNENSYGIYAQYYSDPFLGSSDAYNNRIGGYNSIYDSWSRDVTAYFYTDVEAEYNYWGATPVFLASYASSIDHTPALANFTGGGSSLGKAVSLVDSKSVINDDYLIAGFNPKKPNPNKLSDLWLWGHDLFINNKYEDATEVYQKLVSKFSDNEESKKALVKISHLYNLNDKKNLTHLEHRVYIN